MNGFDRTALNGLTSFASDYSAWTGRKGVTDRIVFEVLIEIAKSDADKEGNFSASYRQVANLTNITHKTIMGSFRRLIQEGLILRKNAGLSGITSIWSFTPQLLEGASKYTKSIPNLSGLIKILQDEMGLHKNSARVYKVLCILAQKCAIEINLLHTLIADIAHMPYKASRFSNRFRSTPLLARHQVGVSILVLMYYLVVANFHQSNLYNKTIVNALFYT